MADEKLTYPRIVKLKYPVQWGEELISELRLRRGKGKELRIFQGGEASIDDMTNLLAQLSGQPPSGIEERKREDVRGA